MDKKRHATTTPPSAQHPGAALREVAARFSAWKEQRSEIAGQLRQIVVSAREMLAQLGDSPAGGPASSVNKGGRPRGYKTSAATKAKLRAAWARRKALAAGSGAAAPSAPSPRGKARRKMSAEARARIATAQKRRWAAAKNAKTSTKK